VRGAPPAHHPLEDLLSKFFTHIGSLRTNRRIFNAKNTIKFIYFKCVGFFNGFGEFGGVICVLACNLLESDSGWVLWAH
jgi:hypothetical protein